MSSNPEREANDAQDIEYGFRDSRRGVSYEHRGSSSLTPRQLMEREIYTSWIYYLFDRALEHLQLMVYFQSTFTRLRPRPLLLLLPAAAPAAAPPAHLG
jgi:hypothetical protein